MVPWGRAEQPHDVTDCAEDVPARVAKAKTKRAARHTIRQELRAVSALDDLDAWDEANDLRRQPSIEIRLIVLHRRDGDKLNHFERWAIARTRHLRPEDRLARLQALLPAGLIGDHALSHLRRRPELNPSLSPSPWRLTWEAHRHAQRQATTRERHHLEAAVRSLVESHNAALYHLLRDVNRDG